jgi:hypothetical protein
VPFNEEFILSFLIGSRSLFQRPLSHKALYFGLSGEKLALNPAEFAVEWASLVMVKRKIVNGLDP